MRHITRLRYAELLLVVGLLAANAHAGAVGTTGCDNWNPAIDAASVGDAYEICDEPLEALLNTGQIPYQDSAATDGSCWGEIWEGIGACAETAGTEQIRRGMGPAFRCVPGETGQDIKLLLTDIADTSEHSVFLYSCGGHRTISFNPYMTYRQCISDGRFGCTDVGLGLGGTDWRGRLMGF
ncbi:MAG TPA: hypothetical protein VMW16_09715 [Sedimentisphaerales bacterium]|nr:hypothetical protein [Sedimentisphaerales bacterium]